MNETVDRFASLFEEGVGRFIVLWFIVGGAITFGVVVLTAQNQWPGLYYVAMWIALGIVFSPTIFWNQSSDPL